MRKQYGEGDDPPRDPIVQQWFQSLDAPPEAKAPPGARLRMLAQIDQRRKPSWAPPWWPSIATPVVATGLAVGLLLSLSLNIWLGRHAVGTRGLNARPVLATHPALSDVPTPLSIYRFQTRLRRTVELETRLAERIPHIAPPPVVGFTPQARRTAFFRLGMLYADALAALHHNMAAAAEPYLALLSQTLTHVQAPSQLSSYLHIIQTHLQEHPRQLDHWQLFLAGFEPLYRDAYAMTEPSIEWILFELGAWTENLYLAAVSGDVQGLQQGRAHQDIRQALEPFQLPPQSLALLAQLQNFIDQPNLSVSDIAMIQRHIQKIQDILGE